MTLRVPSGALKRSSKEEELLEGALDYINKWEAATGPSKRAFLSPGTAEGLRVTLKATLDLLTYLSENAGYKYLLRSRPSQDAIEKLFVIIRQFCGCNDHPTSAQFLTAVNCLCFYNLIKAPDTGNYAGRTRMSFVGTNELASQVDTIVDSGKLDEASNTL
ncbi:hypothetical protein HPB49_003898 [Dermacentor silvarum]|uniref:Uncharacterized protein n=1 Tax=Dermacentor silvarum TaxID=543639 RepID=A0ACB8DMS9_DERSI|nr:hypothetical protein HPB49_003898 [Dermacentor silvarum]